MVNLSENASNILAQKCRYEWPIEVCYFGNICGLISTVIWFLVLLPQVLRSFRFKSVEGLSLGWAILNFTAALNNTFFVYKIPGGLPLYARISAVYMPILEVLLLGEFFWFTSHSKKKILITAVLCLIWGVLVAGQLIFDIYRVMEWVSITMWSIETFPQIWLNSKRQSTYGMSNLMVLLTTIGKNTDFAASYLLVLPIQYVVLAYFSSSVAILNTLQVIWYWNQRPAAEADFHDVSAAEKAEKSDESSSDLVKLHTPAYCNGLRYTGLTVFGLELGLFAGALVWCTYNVVTPAVSLLAPVAVVVVVATGWAWYHVRCLRNFKEKFC